MLPKGVNLSNPFPDPEELLFSVDPNLKIRGGKDDPFQARKSGATNY
jgi:hypothetical protein